MTACADIRPRLEEYAAGALPPAEVPAVEEHVRSCSACAAGAAAFRASALWPHARPDLPGGYWEGVLPRVRSRLESGPAFRLPALALRVLSPAAAALFLLALALQLIPLGGGNAAGDAGAILGALEEADLARVAEHHDSEAIITLPAEAPEEAAPDLDDDAVLEDLVDGETGETLYAYLDTDAALGTLAEDEQSELISMLEQPE